MVSTTQSPIAPVAEGDALYAGLAPAERALLEKARVLAAEIYADRRLGTGEPAIAHALGMARSVSELRLDADTRAAALLFSAPAWLPEAEERLREDFGAGVAGLVAGIARLNSLRVVTRAASESSAQRAQVEALRKMLLAMVEDIRVVLLRLASRAQTLRWLASAPPEERRATARETLDIYAPLANRLGVWQLKWELEDLSFRYLEPELYRRLAAMLDARRAEREAFIAQAVAELSRELAAAGIRADISGRPKHIYSIWNKMRAKSLDFSQVLDVHGLRVLVGEVKDCYAALGVVHNLWTPIPAQFDDYISRPKSNGYRSLHTAVIGPDGAPLEVQIRTYEMHREAELGVAAHWRYKEGGGKSDPFDEKIAWLRRVLEWRDEVVGAADWVESCKRAALDDTVYVLTPQGRVIDLPQGSTPVDFAYAVHTDLGHRCRGAKVNGAIEPLDYKLKTGDRVEIIAAKTGGPSRDWLNPALGYLRSARARHKVRQWFNSQEHAQVVAAGRAIVERELQREGKKDENLDTLARRLGQPRAEDLFAAVGREEIGPRQLQVALRGEPAPSAPSRPRAERPRRASAAVLIVGVDRLLTQLARCCKPAPPDAITGFVTRGRGVTVHRSDCAGLARLLARAPERRIAAEWGARGDELYPVDITVRANDRQGLLRDVSEALAREKANIAAVNVQTRGGIALMQFTVEVGDVDHLRRALAAIEDVRSVIAAARR